MDINGKVTRATVGQVRLGWWVSKECGELCDLSPTTLQVGYRCWRWLSKWEEKPALGVL